MKPTYLLAGKLGQVTTDLKGSLEAACYFGLAFIIFGVMFDRLLSIHWTILFQRRAQRLCPTQNIFMVMIVFVHHSCWENSVTYMLLLYSRVLYRSIITLQTNCNASNIEICRSVYEPDEILLAVIRFRSHGYPTMAKNVWFFF